MMECGLKTTMNLSESTEKRGTGIVMEVNSRKLKAMS